MFCSFPFLLSSILFFSSLTSKDLKKTRRQPYECIAGEKAFQRGISMVWQGWIEQGQKCGNNEVRDQLDLYKPCEGFGFHPE